MRTRRNLVVFAAACIIAGPLARLVFAQQEAAKPPAKEPDYKIIDIKNADVLKRKWGAEKTVLLTGNVVIAHGDTVIKSDKIEYNEDTEIAKSPGRIIISDPDNEIAGDKGTAYMKERRGVLEGNIKLVAKPKAKQSPNAKSAEWKEKAVVTCGKIEYLYKQKLATASGNLKIVQKDRTVTAEKAVYLVKDEIVTLTGNVRGSDEKGQTMSAGGKVRVSLKEGDEWIELEKASGSFRVREEEETSPSPEPKPSTAAAPPKVPQ